MDKKLKPTMLGKLLQQVQTTRAVVRKQAIANLWKRNNLTPEQEGYKLAETVTVTHNGREFTEYRLYKLIDASVTTVTAEVRHSVETGIRAVVEVEKPWTKPPTPKPKSE